MDRPGGEARFESRPANFTGASSTCAHSLLPKASIIRLQEAPHLSLLLPSSWDADSMASFLHLKGVQRPWPGGTWSASPALRHPRKCLLGLCNAQLRTLKGTRNSPWLGPAWPKEGSLAPSPAEGTEAAADSKFKTIMCRINLTRPSSRSMEIFPLLVGERTHPRRAWSSPGAGWNSYH